MIEWMDRNGEIVDGRGTYQIKKLRAAMQFVKQFRCAVDIGAHVGFWSMHLSSRFQSVQAFEPVAEHRACFEINAGGPGVTLHACALGKAPGMVAMAIPPGSSGGTHVAGSGDVPMNRLDAFDLRDVDFIKIDCEGYELDVLLGAAATIERCKPCVIVEQKPHKIRDFGYTRPEAVEFLESLGAVRRQELSGDYILSWD